jgi:hypothetical protein
MLFRTPLRCARFLKTQSNRRTTALPTGAVRHRTTGVTSASRRILGYQKTALNHLVARLLVNEADNGRDVALGLARSNRHPANHLRASPRQALKADLAMLRRHLGPSEIDGAPADQLNNMKECGAPDDSPTGRRLLSLTVTQASFGIRLARICDIL